MRVDASDADLVGQALAGSQAACRTLVARYTPAAVNFIARMVSDRAIADDLTQETFIRVFQRLATYDPSRRFLSWFLQVAHNVTIDYLRRKRLDVVSLDALVEAGHPGAFASSAVSPAGLAERHALSGTIERALRCIRPEYRAAIVLHYHQDLGHAEISAILGVPIPTVKTYLHRGRKELAGLLTEAGWSPRETLSPEVP